MKSTKGIEMKLNELKLNPKRVKESKRIGRGTGSGFGKTSGKGHKGLKSRSGGRVRIGFEGGQMPLQRRVPKFGFKNINRIAYKGINLDTLQNLAEEKKVKKEVTFDKLVELRLAGKNELVKILGRGKLESPLKVSAHKFSATAKAAIEAAGGEAVTI